MHAPKNYALHSNTWNDLVCQSKPITDRSTCNRTSLRFGANHTQVWQNIYPRLLPILEENREHRLAEDRSIRWQGRQIRIKTLLDEIKLGWDPYVQAATTNVIGATITKFEGAFDPQAIHIAPLDTSVQNLTPRAPFPSLEAVQNWPVLVDLFERDVPAEEIEEDLVQRHVAIQEAAVEWIAEVEGYLASCIRSVQSDQDNSGPSVRLHNKTGSTVLGDTSSDTESESELVDEPSDILSEDLRLIVRADAVFDHHGRLCFYPEDFCDVDPSTATYHSGWSAIARALLGCLRWPDALFSDVKAVECRFACGRCVSDMCPKDWVSMVCAALDA
jgi:hypothetical protein